MHQGSTDINGPHQGGIVELESGEWWFVHFQSKDAYGRIVHLQPAKWIDCFPYIGSLEGGKKIGERINAQEGVWIGAKVGLFSINPNINKSRGHADFENFVVE